MSAPKVFLSYARADLQIARGFEQALTAKGVSVWRDQESIYAGQQWPKAIGEAIASSDFLLLVWSRNSAQSYYVEFEWSTAIALRKTILPCLTDDSPLPPSLAAVNGIPLTDFDEGFERLYRSLQPPVAVDDSKHRMEVIRQLESLGAAQPEEVVAAATTLFSRQGWTASGQVARAGPSASGVVAEGIEIGRRYQVVGLLGKGGMGAVYRAHDRELDRDVALKLIRSDLADDPTALERFKREIQLSSTVTHKNVLRVYDLGESEGVKYLTMQFVDGEDLAGLIKREGALPLPRLLDIFQQVCRGLGAAHEKGVLHRDLKPQNIMLDKSGTVYLTDFGLAKSLAQGSMTETGAMLGTPFYMAPEQVKGEEFDSRSDIYSLGVILYEMSTGQLPFQGKSAYDILFQRLQRAPRPARELRPDLPAWLLKILDRCMATDRAARYASADEILADIEAATAPPPERVPSRPLWQKILVASVLLCVLVLAGYWLYLRGRATGPGGGAEATPVVGVVPFDNRTGDAKLDWYGEGMARLVMDNLAQSRHVQVVSAARIQELLSANKDRTSLARAAASGGIAYLLSGDILPGPGGLTVAVRLSETDKGREMAARRIDGLTPQKLIGATDQISLTTRQGLGIPTTEALDVYAADFASKNPEAYQLYLEGLQAFDQYHFIDAERKFTAALEKAPTYTMARYRLAYSLAGQGRTDEALTEVKKALSEVSRLPDREARYVKAAEAYFARRNDEAIAQYRELIQRYPYELEAHGQLPYLLLTTRRYEEAVNQAQILARLAPESHSVWSVLGTAHLNLKKLDEAVKDFRRYVELEPNSANSHHLLADSYRAKGDYNSAAGEYEKALTIDPSFHYASTSLAVVDFLRGRSEDAERRLMSLTSDRRALPRHRIDAALELAYLRRSIGRFREASFILESFEKQIASERIRDALATSIRGTALMECGDLEEAGRLIRRSIEVSPGVPTRYLFALGLLQLRQGQSEDVRRTASKIVEKALPPDNPDRTEDKAAAYLRGMALLLERKADQAIGEFSRCVSLSGYDYGIYRAGLARAYLAAGKLTEALASARESAAPPDPTNPLFNRSYGRLELELDRVRAHLLLGQVHKAMKQSQDAAAEARFFLQRWNRADSELPDLVEARQLIGANSR